VKSILEGTSGTVAVGGETDETTKYIAPTLLVDVQMSDSIMKDEVCISINLCCLSLFIVFKFIYCNFLLHFLSSSVLWPTYAPSFHLFQ